MRTAAAKKLVATLVGNGVIADDQAEALDTGSLRRLVAELRRQQTIDEDVLVSALANILQMPHLPASDIDVTPPVRELLANYHPESSRMLPLYREGGRLFVAVDDPFDIDLHDRAEAVFNAPVELVLVASGALDLAIARWSSGAERLSRVSRTLVAVDEGQSGDVAAEPIDENSAPIVKLFNTILREAVDRKASDIHIEAQPKGTLIRCRRDGVLQSMMEPLDPGYHDALVTRIKVMAELDIAEHRLPQDGRFSAELPQGKIDFRVSILPGAEKEAVVVRVLDGYGGPGGVGALSLDTLGLPDTVLRELRKAVLAPHGLILVTGPTGSGKTTTLYAALNELDRDKEKIITIEDPIEYRLPGILQVPVNEKKKVTFASGLRSILRHDPDKIMVGEIRDAETANIAVQSALTGHLVFTTVHANDSLDVIFRMTHMQIDTDSFVHALHCVLAQRLIRTLCPHCRRPVEKPQDMAAHYGLTDAYAGIKWHTAGGCEQCGGTGYLGRTLIAELLRMTPELRETLKRSGQGYVAETHRGEMPTLRDAALELADNGMTSLEEVMRVVGLE